MSTPRLRALVEALRILPGVGPRSAQRMAIQLLEREVANLRAKQDEKKPAAPAPGQQGLGLEARQQIMPPRDAA